MEKPLVGIRVLDLTNDFCGPYCTQILGDLGAEIIKIEAPEGDPSRKKGTVHGQTSMVYISLNRGKKSVILDLKNKENVRTLLKLTERTDIFVEDFGPGKAETMGFGFETVKKHNNDIIYISINGYGSCSQFCTYSDQDAIIQALSGIMSITGQINGEYTKVGIPIADICTGIYASIAALAGVIYKRRTRRGLQAEISKLSVMLAAMPDSMSKFLNTGKVTRPNGNKHQLVGFFQPVKTKDGYVICMAAQEKQFKAMTEILELYGLEKDERFQNMYARCQNSSELESIIQKRTEQMSRDELSEKLLEQKIPIGAINNMETILNDEYTGFQKLIVNVKDSSEGNFRTVGFPLRFEKFSTASDYISSSPGEYTERVLNELAELKTGKNCCCSISTEDPVKDSQESKPLSGIRILDMTLFMAGPLGTEILQNLGAELIKIERIKSVSDFSRVTEPTFGTTSAYFISMNAGKKDLALDLKNREHQKIVLALSEKCDVVTENFRPGVTKRLGLSYEDIKKHNPNIIYSSVSGFGQKGAYSERGCVDTVAQAISGLMSLTGRENEEPIRVGTSIADVCASLYETVGVLAALIFKNKTGTGCAIDSPMVSTMLSTMSFAAAEYLNCDKVLHKLGNQDRFKPFFDSFPANNGSVMIDASEDSSFAAFVDLLGKPQLKNDARFLNAEYRRVNLKVLEEELFPATRRFSMTQLAESCRSRGIAAGEVFTQEQISRTFYIEQQYLAKFVHDRDEGWFKVIGSPIKFNTFQNTVYDFVPQPGEHSHQILGRILGMSDSEIEKLFMAGNA